MKKRGFLSFAGLPIALLCSGVLLITAAGCGERSNSASERTPSERTLTAQDQSDAAPAPEERPEDNPAAAGEDHAAADEHQSAPDLAPPKHIPLAPPFHGWEQPDVAIVLSGEVHGYFEPCGCSERLSGGYSRRANLFHQLQEKGWPATGLDLGGLANNKRTRQVQSELKFRAMLKAMADMPYRAIGFGPEEILLGWETLLTVDNLNPTQTEFRPAFVCANIKIIDGSLGPRRSMMIEVHGVNIGVTAVLGKSLEKKAFPAGPDPEVTLEDPLEGITEALKDLEAQNPQLLVLLSHASLEESRRFAEQFPQLDLIISAGGPEHGIDKPETIGRTMLVNVGRKGKQVGVVGYYSENNDQRLRYELVELDEDRFEDTPIMQQHMRDYQQTLKNNHEAVFASLTRAGAHPSGSAFVGSEKCSECHTQEWEVWKNSKHANTFYRMETGRKNIPRLYDPECLTCHVTGWNPQGIFRYDSGFQLEELAGKNTELYTLLKGVGCESCHGPGSKHVETAEFADLTEETRESVRITLEQARDRACYTCHDIDNSPFFEFDPYWAHIAH